MSKRLSDTEIWKKPWFFDLPDKYKLFWFYILSDCDAAGIWTVNFKITKAYLGEIDFEKILEYFKGQIGILNGGNYWIVIDFIKFQYGYPIKETAPMHKKINTLLEQRGININTLYDTVYNTVLDTVKDKEEVKVIVKEKAKNKIYTDDFLKFWEAYPKAVSKKKSFEAWQKAEDKPPIEDILAKIELQKKTEQWQKEKGQFIPMSTTYINQARWDDKISERRNPVVVL
jgi:hypothetical protein